MKITIKKINQTILGLTVVLSIALSAYIGYFLYRNLYRIITQADDIIILKKTVLSDNIDLDKFNSTIQKIEDKKNTPDSDEIKNIFTKEVR